MAKFPPLTVRDFTLSDLTNPGLMPSDEGIKKPITPINPNSALRATFPTSSASSAHQDIARFDKDIAKKPIETAPAGRYVEINTNSATQQLPGAEDIKPKTESTDYTYWYIGGGAVLVLIALIYFSSQQN